VGFFKKGVNRTGLSFGESFLDVYLNFYIFFAMLFPNHPFQVSLKPFFLGVSVLFFFSFFSFGLPYDQIVLSVNEEAVTQQMFEKMKEDAKKEADFKREALPKKEILAVILARKLMENALLNSEARILNLNVTEQEVESEVERFKAINQFNSEDLENFFLTNQINLVLFKKDLSDQIRRKILVDRFVNSKIVSNDEFLKSFYEKNFSKNAIHVEGKNFMILLPPKPSKKEIQAAKKEMAGYVPYTKQGKAGERKLESIFNGKSGLEIQSFSLDQEEMIPEFKAATLKLNPGQFSNPIFSPFGVHLVQILKMEKVQGKSYDQVKDQVRDAYYRSEFNRIYFQYIEELEKKAQTQYFDPKFKELIFSYKNDPSPYQK